MRPLSATEAIGPALQRTKDVLAHPFRLRTFLKIAAVAFLAEMGGGINFNSFGRGGVNSLHPLPPAIIAFVVASMVLIAFVSLVIGLILFYIGSRLQLVLLELVATRYTLIGPLWRKYGSRTWRWIGLKLLFLLCILIVLLPFAIAGVVYFIHHLHGIDSFTGFNPFTGLHIAQILLFILVAFVVILVIAALFMLVRDLASPFLALEDLSISHSLERLRSLIVAEPGQVILYILLRLILGLVFGIVAEIAVVITLGLSLIPPGIIGFILWLALHKAGTAGMVLLVACAIVGGLAYLCWATCVVFSFIGSLLTFFQAYALYFSADATPYWATCWTAPHRHPFTPIRQPSHPRLRASPAADAVTRAYPFHP